MDNLFYPAIFELDDNGSFSIEFPDIKGAVTGGSDMKESYRMAYDCLGIVLSYMHDHNEPIPEASLPQDIKLSKNQFIVIIEFNMTEYKKRTNSKAVKKTLSIPSWLNEEAMAKGINFSSVLQDALKKQLNL